MTHLLTALFAVFLLILSGCNRGNGPSDALDTSPQQTDGSHTTGDLSEHDAVAVTNIEQLPEVAPADKAYAGVYHMLDGRWRGTFRTYTRAAGQLDERPDRAFVEQKPWHGEGFEQTGSLEVEQRYESVTDYFQRVTIIDTYPDGRVVESKGVNKIQDGTLYCVVDKPDDLVVHTGEVPGDDTIIWSRDRAEPLAVETFVETVKGETYTIIGWGMYEGDDPNRGPRLFFEATYRRVEE